jgi:hypothetical protein
MTRRYLCACRGLTLIRSEAPLMIPSVEIALHAFRNPSAFKPNPPTTKWWRRWWA